MTPTKVPICFWCTKPKSEVAIGSNFAREFTVHDYDPCTGCRCQMAMGVTCVEVDSAARLNRPPLVTDGPISVLAPTGRWVVIAEATVDKLPLREAQKISVRAAKRAVLDPQVFAMLFGELKSREGNEIDQGNELRLQERGGANGGDGDGGLPGAPESALYPEPAAHDGA